jgi:DAACS family dicarboxylate/amino acid:cation (Na+ or H+) symporter
MNIFKWPIYLQTILAMMLGILLGILLGPKASSLGIVAKYIVEIIKALATPLLFFAIFDAFVSVDLKGKGFFWLIAVCLINACCAIAIALTISNVFKPGTYLPVDPQLKAHLPNVLGIHFQWEKIGNRENAANFFTGTTAAIFISVVLGSVFVFLKFLLGKRFYSTEQFLKTINPRILEFLYKVIGYLVHLTPIAVLTAMAKVVGVQGFGAMKGLAAYLIACAGGMFLQVFLVYQSWIKFFAGMSLKTFWKETKEPMIYSFGINSSLATLPTTLTALKRLKVSEGSARLAACIGTNLNNDGILLYEVVAVFFVAQAFGWHLAIGQQILLALICIIATIGVAGVPEAGMISLALVLSSVGLPVEILPVLMTVDWVLARLRSVNNVIGDMTGAIAIDAGLIKAKKLN